MKRLIILTTAVLFIAACGDNYDDVEVPPEEERLEAPEPATEQRRDVRRATDEPRTAPPPRTDDPARSLPRITGEADVEGHGLTMIVDGSSPEAFRQSLELIAEDTTPEQYQRLDSAIRFLQVRSPVAITGGLEALYSSLDGMTGEEIIEEAQRMRDERRRGGSERQ